MIINILSRLKSLDFMLKRKPYNDMTGQDDNPVNQFHRHVSEDKDKPKTRGDKWHE